MKIILSQSELSSGTSQREAGVALIAVLLFLILIAIAGAIAVRQSSLDLRVATSDQAGALMLNSSDGVLAHIEEVAGGTGTEHDLLMSQTEGVLGYFIPAVSENVNAKVDQQVRFCYTPQAADRMFASSRARTLMPNGGVINGTAGLCNPDESDDYVSGRNTVMTQVVTRGLTSETASSANFLSSATGEQVGSGSIPPSPRVAMHSVSLLPALSSASRDDVVACLNRAVGKTTDDAEAALYGTFGGDNMSQCLQGIGVPNNNLVEEAIIAYNVNANICGNLPADPASDDDMQAYYRALCIGAGLIAATTP